MTILSRMISMKPIAFNRSPRKQTGLTLLENLVALLLISFALLGLAGLITKTLNREKESVFHSLASVQAQDIVERMRVNQSAFVAGNYYTYLSTTAASPASQNCSANFLTASTPDTCDPAKMAQDDAYRWRQVIKKSLPGGVGIVCKDDTPDDGTATTPACAGGTRVVVKIFWRDTKGGGRATDIGAATHANDQRFVMVFQP